MKFGCPHGNSERSFHSSTEERSLGLMHDKRIKRLKETIEATETLLSELTPDELEIVQERYFKRNEWTTIENKLYISRATLFRMNKRILETFGQELGLA